MIVVINRALRSRQAYSHTLSYYRRNNNNNNNTWWFFTFSSSFLFERVRTRARANRNATAESNHRCINYAEQAHRVRINRPLMVVTLHGGGTNVTSATVRASDTPADRRFPFNGDIRPDRYELAEIIPE